MPDPTPATRATRPWLSYKERVSRLAQRLVDAQRPIRVLNAVSGTRAFSRASATPMAELPSVRRRLRSHQHRLRPGG